MCSDKFQSCIKVISSKSQVWNVLFEVMSLVKVALILDNVSKYEATMMNLSMVK